MIKDSILKNTSFQSRLQNTTLIKHNSSHQKCRSLTKPLILTSLIDVFSIMVVYLLVNFSEDTSHFTQGIQLPSAQNGTKIKSQHITVQFKNDQYFINEKKVSSENLINKLSEYKKNNNLKEEEMTLIVQADKKTQYKYLNDIVLAGYQTGYHLMQFAVLIDQAP